MSNKSSEEFFSNYNSLIESFDDYFNQDDFQSIETELIKWENLMSNPIHAKTFLLFSPLEQLFNLINTMPSQSDELSSELRIKIEEHILGIFTKLIQYFNKKNLILFILRCFSYFKESKNMSYFNRLINLIEVAMKNQKEKHNSTSIYLSSVSVPNPNVYNFIYIPSLDSSIEKNQFLFFGIWIKFTQIECLHNFILLKIFNTKYSLSITFKNKNIIIIENDKEIQSISNKIIENNKEYFIVIEINPKNNKFGFYVNNESMIICDININKSKGNFSAAMGFKNQENNFNLNETVELFYFTFSNEKFEKNISDNLLRKKSSGHIGKSGSFKKINNPLMTLNKSQTDSDEKSLTEFEFEEIEFKEEKAKKYFEEFKTIFNINISKEEEERIYYPCIIQKNYKNKKQTMCLISTEDNISKFYESNFTLSSSSLKNKKNLNFIFTGNCFSNYIDDPYFSEFFLGLINEECYEEFKGQLVEIYFKLIPILFGYKVYDSTFTNKMIPLINQMILNGIDKINLERIILNLSNLLTKPKEMELIDEDYENDEDIFIQIQSIIFTLFNQIFLNFNIAKKLSENSLILIFTDLNKIFNNSTQKFLDDNYQSILIGEKNLRNFLLFCNIEKSLMSDNLINLNISYLKVLKKGEQFKLIQKDLNFIETLVQFNNNDLQTNLDLHPNFDKIKNFFDVNLIWQIENYSKKIKEFLEETKEEGKKRSGGGMNCLLCGLIRLYFVIHFEEVKNDVKFHKFIERFHKESLALYKNFDYFSYIGDNYSWALSSKEFRSRIRNKLVLKKNDIVPLEGRSFTYDNNRKLNERHLKYIGNFLDKFCFEHTNFSTSIVDSDDVFLVCNNCLYIKELHKYTGIIVLGRNNIYLCTGLYIDNNKLLHVSKKNFKLTFWTKYDKETEIKELEEEIQQNENKPGKKSQQQSFGYDHPIFKFKKIPLKNITEVHKRRYLHFENSIEIFLKDGSTYFFVFQMGARNNIYTNILYMLSDSTPEIKTFKDQRDNKERFYCRYCPPFNFTKDFCPPFNCKISPKSNIKVPSSNFRCLVENKKLLGDISEYWSQRKVTNFDYLMLLNTIGGRTYSDLSQYFIFPWIFKNFFDDINILDNNNYRLMKYPIFISSEEEFLDHKKKFESNVDDDLFKYHSGNFYSTHLYVYYFLVRLRPYTEVGIEIQNGHFDTADRLFTSTKLLCSTEGHFHELIPELFYLPELFINFNSLDLGITSTKIKVNDVDLPEWCFNDPRLFVLLHRKILEGRFVSDNLHSWIDLIFGYQQSGKGAIDACNTYREPCYPEVFGKDRKDKDLINEDLNEVAEFGCVSKLLFNTPHIQRNQMEIGDELKIFFEKEDNSKEISPKLIDQMEDVYIKIEPEDDEEDEEDTSNKKKKKKKKEKEEEIKIANGPIIYNTLQNKPLYNHPIFDNKINEVKFVKEDHFLSNYCGGISSLTSVMESFPKINISSKKENKIEGKIKYKISFVNSECALMGPKCKKFILFQKKKLRIINPKHSIVYEFNLDIDWNISAIKINEKGNKIYIGLDNGHIKIYKIKSKAKVFFVLDEKSKNIFYVKDETKAKKTESLEENKFIKIDPKIFYDSSFNSNYELITLQNNPEPIYIPSQKQTKLNKIYYLIEDTKTICNIPNKITEIVLNESFGCLIVSDINRIIYIYSLFSFKLINTVELLSLFENNINQIVPVIETGDFLVSTNKTVHLLSLNSIPICDLNLNNSEYDGIDSITRIEYTFISDIILFTGHKDSTINAWKIKNKDQSDAFGSRATFQYDDEVNSNDFVDEYRQIYNNEKIKNINDFELKRKFENVFKSTKCTDNPIAFLKITKDLSHLIVVDLKGKVFIFPENDNEIKKKISKKEQICKICGNNLNENYFGRSAVFENEINKEKKQDYCEECKIKYSSIDTILYGY